MTLTGVEAQGHQEAVGGSWYNNMPLLVKYHGARIHEITPRDDQDN